MTHNPIPATVAELHDVLARDAVTKVPRSMREIAEIVWEWLHPPPAPDSVRVRVAVGFKESGHWAAFGWRNATDEEIRDDAGDYGCNHRLIFLEADIPPPVDEPTVRAKVVP